MNGFGRGEKKDNEGGHSIFTRETLGITLLLFSGLALLIVITRSLMFGEVGIAITAFLMGCLGYLTYPVLVLLILCSIQLFIGKTILPAKWTAWACGLLSVVFLIVHLATSTAYLGNGYGAYLGGCFTAAQGGVATSTGGGLIFGLIVYPVQLVLSLAGAYVIFSFALAVLLFLFLRATPARRLFAKSGQTQKPAAEGSRAPIATRAYPGTFEELPAPARTAPQSWEERREQTAVPPPVYREEVSDEGRRTSRDILYANSPAENYRQNLAYSADSRFNTQPRSNTLHLGVRGDGAQEGANSYQEDYTQATEQSQTNIPRRVQTQTADFRGGADLNYPQTPSYRAPTRSEGASNPYRNDVEPSQAEQAAYDQPAYEQPSYAEPQYERDVQTPSEAPARTEYLQEQTPPVSYRDTFSRTQDEDFSVEYGKEEPEAYSRDIEQAIPERSRAVEGLRSSRDSVSELFDDDTVEDEEEVLPEPTRSRAVEESRSSRMQALNPTPAPPRPTPPPPRVRKPYVRPSHDLFRTYDDRVNVSQEEIERNSAIIIDTLRGFRIEAEILKVTCGPTVTRYDIDIPADIQVSRVINRNEEIAMRLKAGNNVNIYPNSEVGAISIEVPNAHRSTIGLAAVLQAPEYVNGDPGSLMFALGKDVSGRTFTGNVVKMPHMLVAGTSGSGKSVCLNAMLVSLICKYSPEDLRLILVDPKRSEFAVYDGLPHLVINEIISDAQKTIMALNWAIKEMEDRYEKFRVKTMNGENVRDIKGYNNTLAEGESKLPYIVIVVDELADLMSVSKKDIESRIQRLTQKARAAGIHLILATQRPSVDVITGVIKGNLDTRIALRVSQEVDSRIILDESGAEKLLGNGDMLYHFGGKVQRLQGVYIADKEIQDIINDVKQKNESFFDDSISDYINNPAPSSGNAAGAQDGGSVDPKYITALATVVSLGTASISLIQRKLGVGYNHAGKIIEWMDAMGYISPFDGKAKARTVLLSKEEFEEKYGDLE